MRLVIAGGRDLAGADGHVARAMIAFNLHPTT